MVSAIQTAVGAGTWSPLPVRPASASRSRRRHASDRGRQSRPRRSPAPAAGPPQRPPTRSRHRPDRLRALDISTVAGANNAILAMDGALNDDQLRHAARWARFRAGSRASSPTSDHGREPVGRARPHRRRRFRCRDRQPVAAPRSCSRPARRWSRRPMPCRNRSCNCSSDESRAGPERPAGSSASHSAAGPFGPISFVARSRMGRRPPISMMNPS